MVEVTLRDFQSQVIKGDCFHLALSWLPRLLATWNRHAGGATWRARERCQVVLDVQTHRPTNYARQRAFRYPRRILGLPQLTRSRAEISYPH